MVTLSRCTIVDIGTIGIIAATMAMGPPFVSTSVPAIGTTAGTTVVGEQRAERDGADRKVGPVFKYPQHLYVRYSQPGDGIGWRARVGVEGAGGCSSAVRYRSVDAI